MKNKDFEIDMMFNIIKSAMHDLVINEVLLKDNETYSSFVVSARRYADMLVINTLNQIEDLEDRKAYLSMMDDYSDYYRHTMEDLCDEGV